MQVAAYHVRSLRPIVSHFWRTVHRNGGESNVSLLSLPSSFHHRSFTLVASDGFDAVPRRNGEETLLSPISYARDIASFSQTTSSSSSFLEDVTDEYGYGDAEARAAEVNTAAQRSNDALLKAVVANDFASAEALRSNMIRTGIKIAPNIHYERVALDYLQRLGRSKMPSSKIDSDAAFEPVLTWWSLVPDVDDVTGIGAPNAEATIHWLLNHNINLQSVLKFLFLAVTKGYTNDFEHLIPHIVRFSPASVAQQVIEEFDKADLRLSARVKRSRHDGGGRAEGHGLEYADIDIKTRRNIARRRNLVIRTHALAGRLGYATSTLQAMANELPEEIYLRTFFLIMMRLKATNMQSQYWAVKEIAERCFPENDWEDLPDYTISHAGPVSYRAKITPRKLARMLREFRKSVYSQSPPRAEHIEFFIRQCVSLGRTRVLVLMQRRLLRQSHIHGPSGAVLWCTAEVLFYRGQRDYPNAARAFAAYFRLHGVPGRDIVLRILDKDQVPSRRSPLTGIMLRGRGLLFPSSHTIAVLIGALLCKFDHSYGFVEQTKFWSIYQDVLDAYKSYSAPPLDASSDDTPALEHITPPVLLPDATIFNIFAQKVRDTRDLNKVMEGMQSLGLEIGLKNWTKYLRKLALAGEGEAVLAILDRMKDGHEPDAPTRTVLGPVRAIRTTLPRPDAMTFLTTIGGFLKGRKPDLAVIEEMFARLQSGEVQMDQKEVLQCKALHDLYLIERKKIPQISRMRYSKSY